MADSNLPKQDFAPPWLKFPQEASKASSQKTGSHPNDRNRQRRDEPYYPRADIGRLHRQNSFDFPDGKRYPQGQNKYRHHSVDDDFFGYSYGYGGYYPSNYNNYEKFEMHYSSQPSLARSMSRDGKYSGGRFNQMNGCITTNGPHHDLFEPYYQQGTPNKGYRDHHRDSRNGDGKDRDRGSDKDRHYSDDFPSLNGSGDSPAESKPTKPASGVWENPPKSSRSDESSDLLKNTSPGIYKALVPNKNGQNKKNSKDAPKMNGNARDLSPLSPSSSRLNHKEATRQSPTSDLAIVTQPKKLGDKKSDFLRALRNENSVRNGELYQNLNQNNTERKQDTKQEEDSPMSEYNDNFGHMNGDSHLDSNKNLLNGKSDDLLNGDIFNGDINGDTLINDVDHISLSGDDEEKRLLLSMGWVEEDNTEYVITDDEIREFKKQHGLKTALGSTRNRKLVGNGMLNGIPYEEEEIANNKLL